MVFGRSAETFSIFFEEMGGGESWNGKVGVKVMIRVQFLCFIFHSFSHLSKNHFLIYIKILLCQGLLTRDLFSWISLNQTQKRREILRWYFFILSFGQLGLKGGFSCIFSSFVKNIFLQSTNLWPDLGKFTILLLLIIKTIIILLLHFNIFRLELVFLNGVFVDDI